MLSSRDAFFDDTFIYSGNLMLAFAVTAYDSNPNPIEDPSIGVIKPYYKSWGLDDTLSSVRWEQLTTRECTLAELHLRNESDPQSLFYKPHPNSERDLDFYFSKMKCLDQDRIHV